ncbi:YdiU family protein [Alphaproteobacteria bacterium GH1-50]|uniref:Protein nucleotidyltransferase YdiU n=1 Tax=Kangsaoukella pontilimi TaxID=2691042 RepID=A0A7C9MJ86_9RHOB|nr:YdiU family protein [Kangsaoukella pontilimi]MXQ07555.1 YdiU family protein [Kangsaoukella pontilimi]
MMLTMHFDNSYGRLPERFYTRMPPTPVSAPALIKVNTALAKRLGIDPDALSSHEGVAALAGNAVPEGADPLAQVYAGHQFGGFSPRLGDGRALLLGEVLAPDGARFDIQLKGSGPTPYSRMGDGRAWLGPVLREYLVSEAMEALGVPTTRALAAVLTGDTVVREAPLPGAVLTRVAASHIRVGTFQYFASQGDHDALRDLTEHAIARHAPDADGPLGLLAEVTRRQASLIARWMGLGFIHGVMNTDNMTISGETIDYGPCAFMDAYHPMRVFSSIDTGGRYAYARQPDIALWNLAQLATSLLLIMGEDKDAALEAAQGVIDGFPDLFRAEWLRIFRAKIGLTTIEDGDTALIHRLLDVMAAGGSDFTNTFRALHSDVAADQFADRDAFEDWAREWRDRLEREDATPEDRAATMDRVNPAVIPRTHRIEEAIQAGVAGDFEPFEALLATLARPFDVPENTALMRPPTEDEVVPQTFCGT